MEADRAPAKARQGSRQAPHWVGGASVFGPKPRDYGYQMPRRAKQAALCAALTLRAREGKLVVVENFTTDGKTKSVASALKALGAPQPTTKALVVDGISQGKTRSAKGEAITAKANTNLIRGAKNLASSQWLAADGINVYDILRHEILVLNRGRRQDDPGSPPLTGAA